MSRRVMFIMGLHSHQPVGNFDFVFETATRECYQPFLEALSRYPQIRMSLHYSGILLEWIREHHPETFDLLGRLVSDGRVEMMGGGFDEPILVMIPDRDKLGQIEKLSDYLLKNFGVKPEGLWLAERVWEQSLVSPIADAGMKYVPVDDSHFRFAGIMGEKLSCYYNTEDRGRVLDIFPMDELLRYYVPFQDPEKTIEYLRDVATEDGTALLTYADDGEKFGSWPETHKHVYTDGWLERFFRMLSENSDWIDIITFAEARKRIKPKGQVFLPDASYREMMEWVLPVESRHAYEDTVEQMKNEGTWDSAKFFVKGSTWRGFRSKYPEANDMYSKMMLVSDKVNALVGTNGRYEAARDELYKGQCNCSYWHGVFGGLYLPHLRFAIYKHLISAENIADHARHGDKDWCESRVLDYNFDGRDEVLLSSKHLSLYVVPHRGGHVAEMDIRLKAFNPLGVFTRRVEAYHRAVLQKNDADKTEADDEVGSIHGKVVFKSEGLDRMLQYDSYKREGFIDHVFSKDATLEDFAGAGIDETGDFTDSPYDFEVENNDDVQIVIMKRTGTLQTPDGPVPLTIVKQISLRSGESGFSTEYELRGPDDRAVSFVFGVETNYAMLAAHADDRYYYRENNDNRLGQLASRVDEKSVTKFGIVDEWQQLDIGLTFSEPADVWTFPLETVSQSEAGFEAVYQGSVVLSRWAVGLQPGQTWKVAVTTGV